MTFVNMSNMYRISFPVIIGRLQYFNCLKWKCRCISSGGGLAHIKNDEIGVHIFDRNTKTLQRERAAVATDVNLYDYLKDEIGYRLADRVFDIKRKFKLAADIGIVPYQVSILEKYFDRYLKQI